MASVNFYRYLLVKISTPSILTVRKGVGVKFYWLRFPKLEISLLLFAQKDVKSRICKTI